MRFPNSPVIVDNANRGSLRPMEPPSPPLPTARAFLTNLVSALSQIPATAASNPLRDADASTRSLLLTLYALFPNDLLPALDLLDRRLVTRFLVRAAPEPSDQTSATAREAAIASRRRDGASTPHPPLHSDGRLSAGVAGDGDEADDARPNAPTSPPSSGDPNADISIAIPLSTTTASVPPDAAAMATDHGRPQRPVPALPHRDAAVPRPGTARNAQSPQPPPPAVYYVRSAQPTRPSRYAAAFDLTSHYEVRLRPWNCTCPAFAFAAFPAHHHPPGQHEAPGAAGPRDVGVAEQWGRILRESWARSNGGGCGRGDGPGSSDGEWVFGGLMRGDATPPVCKHLLACVLGERCPLFGAFVQERVVSVEEAAGWAAGWGG